MKRDLDLIRKILFEMEEAPPGKPASDWFSVEGYEDAIVIEHVRLLEEAGFLTAQIVDSARGPVGVRVGRLTWQGHEFLDVARNDTLWKRTKEQITAHAASVPVEILRWLLSEGMKALFRPSG